MSKIDHQPEFIVDLMDKEQFFKSGQQIRTAVYERIHSSLSNQLQNYIVMLESELETLPSKEVTGLLLAMERNKDLSPKALCIKNYVKWCGSIMQEIEELRYIVQNIDLDKYYRLDLDKLKRYGFRGEE